MQGNVFLEQRRPRKNIQIVAPTDATVLILGESGGVIAGRMGAAARLGLKRTTLQSRMKRLEIRRGFE